MRRALAITFMLLCFAATGLGIYNVFSDNADVQTLAKTAACGGKDDGCALQMTRMERNPFGQGFAYRASATAKEVEVRWRRAYWLLGAWSCRVP